MGFPIFGELTLYLDYNVADFGISFNIYKVTFISNFVIIPTKEGLVFLLYWINTPEEVATAQPEGLLWNLCSRTEE